jgi:hypothetical protein
MIRRIFAGSIVLLLLSVSPIAVACDLSCAFAPMNSDCHSRQTRLQASPSSEMNMAGMSMAGMTMPETAGGENSRSVFAMAGGMRNHPRVGEMGLCERQSCDNGPAVSASANLSVDFRFHSSPAFMGILRATNASTHFLDTRDDIAFHRRRAASPFHPTLRI